MLTFAAPLLMALAALVGFAEQMWPTAVGAPVGVLRGQDVVKFVQPLLGWDHAGHDHLHVSNYSLQVPGTEARRLQQSCDAEDAEAVRTQALSECTLNCTSCQVSVSNCVYVANYVTTRTCRCLTTSWCRTISLGDMWIGGAAISFGGLFGTVIFIVVLDVVAWVLVQFVVGACLWASIRQAGQSDPMPLVGNDTANFESEVLDCCQEGNICICGWCFPAVRASQTLYAANIQGFWTALAIYTVGGVLPFATFIMRLHYRMALRRKAGLQPDCWNDCCCTFWFGPCSMCQEARHVQKALLQSRSVVGPVGKPVVMAQVV